MLILHNAYPGVVATAMVVQVIDEKPFYTVLENNSHHTEAAFHHGVPLFDDFTNPPLEKPEVCDLVAGLEIKPPVHWLV